MTSAWNWISKSWILKPLIPIVRFKEFDAEKDMETLREMTYNFHPEAENEFLSAINYYEESHIGLGHNFAREVYSAVQSIIEHPKTWPNFSK